MNADRNKFYPPSDKDAITSAPDGDGGYVLTTVNQYPSHRLPEQDWRGALIEETTAYRADVEQFRDVHTLLWDADEEQTLDVRNDAAASDVTYESSRVPEIHIHNDFDFASGATAELDQDVIISYGRTAMLVRNRATFDESHERTLFTVVSSSIHSENNEEDGDEAYVMDHAGYECVVSHDGERYYAFGQKRVDENQTGFDGQRIGLKGYADGDEKSAWADIYEENDGYIDENDGNSGVIDIGVGLYVDDETDVEWLTGFGFGKSEEEALDNLTETLDAGYEDERDEFADVWETWHESVSDGPTDDEMANELYVRSLTTMKCAQSPRGPMIAGAFEPGTDGYKYVWPRDQVILIQALLAAGAPDEAQDALGWLKEAQITDDVTDDRDIQRSGTWWQNYRTDGEPHWMALQLDQVAGPIYAHWLFWQASDGDDALDDYYEMSERAAAFLLDYDNGSGFPGKHQDLWEEVWGYSPQGVASAVAGLRAMAELAEAKGDDDLADDCRERAETWASNLDKYCYKEDGMYGEHYVTADDPETPDDPSPDVRPDASAFMTYWPWNVKAADSDELQSTLSFADDEGWCASNTPCVARYPEDNYTPSGDVEDGGWPLCEAYADMVRWQSGVDETAVESFLFEDAPRWTTAAGLLSEQIDGDGDIRWNAPLEWTHAMYVLLAESHVSGEPVGMAPSAD